MVCNLQQLLYLCHVSKYIYHRVGERVVSKVFLDALGKAPQPTLNNAFRLVIVQHHLQNPDLLLVELLVAMLAKIVLSRETGDLLEIMIFRDVPSIQSCCGDETQRPLPTASDTDKNKGRVLVEGPGRGSHHSSQA